MANSWYFKINDLENGPVSSARILQLVADGTITRDTPLRNGESGRWVPAVSVRGINFSPLTPPPTQQQHTAPSAPKWLYGLAAVVILCLCTVGYFILQTARTREEEQQRLHANQRVTELIQEATSLRKDGELQRAKDTLNEAVQVPNATNKEEAAVLLRSIESEELQKLRTEIAKLKSTATATRSAPEAKLTEEPKASIDDTAPQPGDTAKEQRANKHGTTEPPRELASPDHVRENSGLPHKDEPPLSHDLNLVTAIDIPTHVIDGTWQRQGTSVGVIQNKGGAIRLPGALATGSYRFIFTVTRSEGTKAFGIIFPVGKAHCAIEFGEGTVSGIGMISGHSALNNATTRPSRIINGQQHTCALEVTVDRANASIRASLDGEPYLSWQGHPSSLSLSNGRHATTGEFHLFSFGERNTTFFHSAILEHIDAPQVAANNPSARDHTALNPPATDRLVQNPSAPHQAEQLRNARLAILATAYNTVEKEAERVLDIISTESEKIQYAPASRQRSELQALGYALRTEATSTLEEAVRELKAVKVPPEFEELHNRFIAKINATIDKVRAAAAFLENGTVDFSAANAANKAAHDFDEEFRRMSNISWEEARTGKRRQPNDMREWRDIEDHVIAKGTVSRVTTARLLYKRERAVALVCDPYGDWLEVTKLPIQLREPIARILEASSYSGLRSSSRSWGPHSSASRSFKVVIFDDGEEKHWYPYDDLSEHDKILVDKITGK